MTERKKYITTAGKPEWSDTAGCKVVVVYMVLTREGEIKRTKNGLSAFIQEKRAVLWAKDEGDSVVWVEIPLNQAPLFIHKKTV